MVIINVDAGWGIARAEEQSVGYVIATGPPRFDEHCLERKGLKLRDSLC